MKVWQVEAKIYEVEGIVVVIRANPNEEIGDYTYKRCSDGNQTVSAWQDGRLKDVLKGKDVSVIFGDYSTAPHGLNKLSTVRDSYNKK